MAQNPHTHGDDQFFRRMYDFLYTVTWDDIRGWYSSTIGRLDRRTRWLIVTILASAFLLWAMLQLAQVGLSALEWASRPSVTDRLIAPYDLERRAMPLMNLDIIPAEGETLSEGNYYLPETVASFTRLTVAPGLLEVCLLSAGNSSYPANCGLNTDAQYMEQAGYIDADGHSVGVVMAQFSSEEEAGKVLAKMYNYSRAIGRIGNYALLTNRTVDYFYSSSRDRFSFSWSNGPWVYTASSADLGVLENLLIAFPY